MSKELRAVLVDDEPLARDELGFMLGELDVKIVGEAASADAALKVVEESQPDLAFLDLRIPGPDGIALAETLRSRFPDLAMVMVSAHDEGALRAFEADILDYLLKPVRFERLKTAVERARNQLVTAAPSVEPLDRLAVRRKGAYVVVDIADVLFFQVKDELVWAVTKEDRFALDLTLSALDKKLDTTEFFRSHRSCLVRLSAISAIEPVGSGAYELVITHPESPRVPLARERVRTLREYIPFAG
ncbi:MAG: two-component system response regulator LytT [Polyangiales bacterium]|jgi:two-component system response regulator LytT